MSVLIARSILCPTPSRGALPLDPTPVEAVDRAQAQMDSPPPARFPRVRDVSPALREYLKRPYALHAEAQAQGLSMGRLIRDLSLLDPVHRREVARIFGLSAGRGTEMEPLRTDLQRIQRVLERIAAASQQCGECGLLDEKDSVNPKVGEIYRDEDLRAARALIDAVTPALRQAHRLFHRAVGVPPEAGRLDEARRLLGLS